MTVGLETKDLIIFGLGLIAYLIWLVLYIRGLKYNALFEVLDNKEFPLKEVYGIGYGVLEQIHYGYKSKGDRKLRQELDVLYGQKYSDYYLRTLHSEQITLLVTIIVVAFSLYGLTGEIAAMLIGLMFAGLAYYYVGTLPKKRIDERTDELLHDFSEVVSKLALLTNAGMILREAWEEVAFAGDSVIYKEMQSAVSEMQNGVADIDAIYSFGVRCIIPEVKKFASTIVQGMTKGNRELATMLQEQSKEAWQIKQQIVRREGETAATKLLLPLCIMFVGILIMIVVPIFANIGNA